MTPVGTSPSLRRTSLLCYPIDWVMCPEGYALYEEKKRRNLSALWGLVSPEQIRAEKIVGMAERREKI